MIRAEAMISLDVNANPGEGDDEEVAMSSIKFLRKRRSKNFNENEDFGLIEVGHQFEDIMIVWLTTLGHFGSSRCLMRWTLLTRRSGWCPWTLEPPPQTLEPPPTPFNKIYWCLLTSLGMPSPGSEGSLKRVYMPWLDESCCPILIFVQGLGSLMLPFGREEEKSC